MTNPLAVGRTVCVSVRREDGSYDPELTEDVLRVVVTYCPGCRCQHRFQVELLKPGWTGRGDGSPEPIWEWDGKLDPPTFSPSMLAHGVVHLCEGEHEIYVCEAAGAEGGFEHCDHRHHGYAWRLEDGTLRSFKVYEAMPPGAVRVVTCGQSPHPREPAYGDCHSFLRAGVWDFLGDSAHDLAGQKVPMVPLPDWLWRRGVDDA